MAKKPTPLERLLGRLDHLDPVRRAIKLILMLTRESAVPARHEAPAGMFQMNLDGGLPHQLLVLTDVSRALSDEERQAWKRLIRVLSHELNNSLAPIKSIADSLLALITREPAPPDPRLLIVTLAQGERRLGQLLVISPEIEARRGFLIALAG